MESEEISKRRDFESGEILKRRVFKSGEISSRTAGGFDSERFRVGKVSTPRSFDSERSRCDRRVN